MSPFVSIKSVANNKVGFLSFLIADIFDNLSKMPLVECATFIVHGQKDSLIPVGQAQDLDEACGGTSFLLTPPNMTHNDFNFYEDLIQPLTRFLVQMQVMKSDDFEPDTAE